MDNPKRARSEKPRKQPRECAYVRSPDLQSALERIRQVACRDKGAWRTWSSRSIDTGSP